MRYVKYSVVWFLLIAAVFIGHSQVLFSQNSTKSLKELQEQTDRIHKRIFSIDTHNDTALSINNPKEDQGVTTGQVSFPLMKEGGLDAALFAIYIGQKERDKKSLDSAVAYAKDNLLKFRSYVENYRGASLAYCSEDLLRNKRNGVTSVVLAIENGYAIGDDISNLEMFRDIGVRAITICHNENNNICDSSRDPNGPEHNGLSPFGKEVIKEMNRLGIIIDVSHSSVKTLFDVLEVSESPIMASHSGVWEIKNHPRNLRDNEIIAIAKAGGLIQVATGRFFLSHLPKDSVTVKHLADHIDYVKNLVGIDHVGLGTDYDGGGGVVGMEKASKIKNLTIELLRRGYTEEELEKFWGANFIKFLKTQNL